MLHVGTTAPEIDAVTTDGSRFRLSEQRDRTCTVLFFFPKAFTPGCSRETASFRDNHNELQLAGAALIGISTDDHATQCSFAESLKAPFPMIGDPMATLAEAYDVRWPLVRLAQRVTYVISPERIVLGAFHHELRIAKHRDEVLRMVDNLFRQRRATEG